MPVHVTANRRGWVYAPFQCESCQHEDQGAVYSKASAAAQTNLLQGVDETRDLAMGTAHGNMEQAGDEAIALAPCPSCGQRDELAMKSFRRRANPWLGWGGVFTALGLGGAGYLLSEGEDFGKILMAPLIVAGLALLAVGLFKRFRPPPKGVVFYSVDPGPWAHLR